MGKTNALSLFYIGKTLATGHIGNNWKIISKNQHVKIMICQYI